METVLVDEAETKLADLLDRAERGEELTITRRGKIVARLVPAASRHPRHDPERVREALLRMDELRPQMRLDGLRIKDLINAGRP